MVKQEGSENSRMLMPREATEEKVELGMDKREENKMGRTQRPEEEKETWKVTAAQTQKRESERRADNQGMCTADGGEGGGSWSGDQTGLRDRLTGDEKKGVMRRETAQMNRRR